MDASSETGRDEDGSAVLRPPKGKRVVVNKYTQHACAQCRRAKAKCIGGKPVCERCQRTGHECNWSAEDARRPLTRAYEQALKHQNTLLRAEVDRLNLEVESLRLAASGSLNPPSVGSVPSPVHKRIPIAADHTLSAPSNDSSGLHSVMVTRAPSLHGASNEDAETANLWGLVPVEDIASDAQEDIDFADSGFNTDVESAGESDDETDDSDIDVDKALVAPTKTLFSEQDDFHHYGLTSVFRLRRRASDRKVRTRSHGAAEDRKNGYESAPSSRRNVRGQKGLESLQSDLSPSSSVDAEQSQYLPSHLSDDPQDNITFERSRKGRKRPPRTDIARAIPPARMQRHILLVGDHNDCIWKGCECQSDCWNLWLPKGVPLSRKEHDVLLDRVFLFFTSWCMRIIPEYFLRDMYIYLHPSSHRAAGASLAQRPATSLPRLAHYSPFLHNMLLAVGSAFSSDPDIRKPETRARFAEEGKAYIDEECSRPNISTVQALGLLASYYSGQGQQTLGFTYFGMSTRIAQALGLFADCTPLLRAGRLRSQQVFDRMWCFHMAAAQDVCWSLYVGRECGIPLPPATKHDQKKDVRNGTSGDPVSLSLRDANGDGATFSMSNPFCLSLIAAGEPSETLDKMTWRSRGVSTDVIEDDVPECKTFTTFQWSCQMMKIGRSIMDLMNRLASSDSNPEIKLLVSDIDMQLDKWRQGLPADLKLTPANEMSALPHKLMIHSAFWWQHILLHRPFFRQRRTNSVDSQFSISRCNTAAREILHILRLWRKINGSVRYCPITLIQAIFSAGTIYILQAMQSATRRRPATQSQASALNNLDELVGFLRECSESWECAIRIADLFEKLLKEQRRAMEAGVKGNETKRNAKKRRRLETMREAEAIAQSALLNVTPASSDARNDEISANTQTPSPGSQLVSGPSFAPDAPSGAIFHLSSQSDHLNPGDSPTFSPTRTETSHLFGHQGQIAHNTSSNSEPWITGACAPSYPTGYLSDESYTSDALYPSTDDHDQDFYMGGVMSDHPDPTNDFHMDLSFLHTSEVNMDAIMPGIGMGMDVFDPTGLPGLALGSMPMDDAAYPYPLSASYVSDIDGYAASADAEGFVGGHTNALADWNAMGNDEDDALFDLLASVSTQRPF